MYPAFVGVNHSWPGWNAQAGAEGVSPGRIDAEVSASILDPIRATEANLLRLAVPRDRSESGQSRIHKTAPSHLWIYRDFS